MTTWKIVKYFREKKLKLCVQKRLYLLFTVFYPGFGGGGHAGLCTISGEVLLNMTSPQCIKHQNKWLTIYKIHYIHISHVFREKKTGKTKKYPC